MNDILLSSTGEGMKLRIKSLGLLAIPVINELLRAKGIQIVPDSFNTFVDATFVIVGTLSHIWGWVRAQKNA